MFESVENPEKQILIKAKDMKDDKTLFPLVNTSTIDTEPKISYAVWSPIGHQVAYVMENDLYITDLKIHTRITFDGSATIFNGIPDWVYEEEVFSQSYSLWWSPDATHLAYLRLDETEVPELHIPFYTLEDENSYPVEMSVKYPKAGAPNPLASLFIYSLTTKKTTMVTKNSTSDITINAKKGHEDFDEKDRIITEVHWTTDSHNTLLFKQTNRVQDQELTNMVMIFDEQDPKMIKLPTSPSFSSSYVATIRKYQPKDGGWVDSGHSISYLGEYRDADDALSIDYIDVIDNGKGHFLSSERSPLERHLYTITLGESDPTLSKKCLTCPEDPEVHSYYRADFSPLGGYYVLYYDGPDVPTTVVKKVDDPSFELTLQKNENFKNLIAKYDLPKKRMLTVNSGSYDMNVLEILPPNFDIEQKYPVVFYVYGGPRSQSVTYEFNLDWHTFLASKLQYIVVIVDGRGTGFRGREYRVDVRKRLGELETIDITNAARHWANLDYVDHSRIAIWGWSYGGYLVSKCLEADSGIFNSGLAVAPVTDWRYYDSIYTERYMLTPKMNPTGYTNSAVNNMTGFANSKFLLIHGTGDDNGKL
ncbi:dipeptidyl peptidase IV N-terminal region-domain-containing protein [Cunninghamella echinulata]|nr:dipeptidyl peptidase IV N-terminal region-domain-containing protein [Cunninghamella echinulata]